MRKANESVGMRDSAFREYAETTGRELVGVVRNQIEFLRSVRRRRSSPPIENERKGHELATGEAPSLDEARTPFSRELGDTWVEVEPGIYKHAASPPSESVLPTPIR